MNKIKLYRPVSWWGRLICFVTNSEYSHAAIEYYGVLYDSSEKRGTFGFSNLNFKLRDYDEFEFSGDLGPWIADTLGKEYDWVGVWGWLFSAGDKDKFYCFESAYDALLYTGLATEKLSRVSANDIISVFDNINTNIN